MRKRRVLLSAFLFGLLLSLMFCTMAQAEWKTTKQGKRYYIREEKTYAIGWSKIGKKWYYFNEKGYLQKGWLTVDGKRFYLDKNTGERVSSKWFKAGKSYFYAGKNGALQKNKWINGCYVKANYRRASGWLKLDGVTYYMNPSTGKKSTGWKTINGKRYYFNKGGILVTSKWKKVNGNYYYLQADGSVAVNTWVDQYYVGKDGARTGQIRYAGIVKKNGKVYYYNTNYKKVKGWITADGKRYYFGGAGKAAVTGLQTIGLDQYYFNTDGEMQIGWQYINGVAYYFDADGAMVKGRTIMIEGTFYTFDINGYWEGGTTGQLIANYALQFVGNPYVYGGTSLTNGADCSGFTYSVMAHFDIKIPRVADDQRKGTDAYGTYTESVAINKVENILAGDLLFYGSTNPKYANHVALYIGNGKVVHASDENTGIIISDYDYRKPIAARRYWK